MLIDSELKKTILQEFHTKSYSCHPPEDIDNIEEVLSLAEFEEGRGKVCG